MLTKKGIMEFTYFLRRIVNKIMTLKQSALANNGRHYFYGRKIDIGVERKRGVTIRKDSGQDRTAYNMDKSRLADNNDRDWS